MAIRLDYYHSTTDFVRYLYYRVPKILFEAAELRGVTFDARMFFIFLLDRTSLSALNGWIDETGRVYIFYTLKA
ncbi:MAG: replication initiator protein A, partial [Abditibacteriota bacterium]|nr:replication initiator protein A [Abditibacteriota bacterium]